MERMHAVIDLQRRLRELGYIADRPLAATLMLMDDLRRPLLLEGEAGAGKTEVAKVLAQLHATDCVRLQCYEGLDSHAALYEWNYQRQLLAIRLLEHDTRSVEAKEAGIFSERYLLKRPLLDSITREHPVVLLIDEIDRADEAFEAYLLELLSDFQTLYPGTGHHKGPLAPLGRAHQQRHPRAIGRAAQTLPLSLRRISVFRQGAVDCRDTGPRSSAETRPATRRIRAVTAPGRSTAQARNRGNARLGGSPVAPRYNSPRRSNTRSHSRQPRDAAED